MGSGIGTAPGNWVVRHILVRPKSGPACLSAVGVRRLEEGHRQQRQPLSVQYAAQRYGGALPLSPDRGFSEGRDARPGMLSAVSAHHLAVERDQGRVTV